MTNARKINPKQIDKNKFNEICKVILNCKGNTVLMGIGKSGNTYAKIFNREVISKIRHNFRSSETILNSSKFI